MALGWDVALKVHVNMSILEYIRIRIMIVNY